MFRFIHTSDLHIGKTFGQFEEDLRVPLKQARLEAVESLAQKAEENDASHILVAGDIFDTGTPNERSFRQFLRIMSESKNTIWVLLPGNHDPLNCEPLWQRLAGEKSENVILALEARPIEITEHVLLLPSPCRVKRHGEDTTGWMDEVASADGQIRIGLAHGPVYNFGEEGSGDIINPDRARDAGLSYLALGDWHGQVKINDRTWYSGTPEPDRFKHDRPGQCLLVVIDGLDSMPSVTPLETGKFFWEKVTCSLLPDDDIEATLHPSLPDLSRKQTTLLQLTVEGRATLSGHNTLKALAENERPELAYLELRDSELDTEIDDSDLANIDLSGSLRAVAMQLKSEMEDDTLDQNARKIADLALRRLCSLSLEAG